MIGEVDTTTGGAITIDTTIGGGTTTGGTMTAGETTTTTGGAITIGATATTRAARRWGCRKAARSRSMHVRSRLCWGGKGGGGVQHALVRQARLEARSDATER